MATSSLVVIGSLNLDLSASTLRLPLPGETVIGGDLLTAPGGKGGNQAVAMARLGARVTMVGRTGDDDPGRRLRTSLVAAGVSIAGVAVDETAPSGAALIFVDEAGENSIVVAPGANSRVCPADVDAVRRVVAEAPVVVLQLEIPLATVAHGAKVATGTVVLNPAPAAELPPDLLAEVEVLVPNRTELAILAGEAPAESLAGVTDQALGLKGIKSLVVTLGAEGALVVENGRAVHIAAEKVEAVDTTGAGDAFVGALAVGISEGADLASAARLACRAAAVAVGRRGAQSALATREDLS